MYNKPKPQNGGALFPRQKRSENSPDMGGDLMIEGDLLNYIMQNAGSGQVKIELGAWRRSDRNGKSFYSLKGSPPFERPAMDRGQGFGNQGYGRQGGQRQGGQGGQGGYGRQSYNQNQRGGYNQSQQQDLLPGNDLDDEMPF